MVFTRQLTKEETAILLKLQNFVRSAHAESNSHDYAHVLSVCKYAIQIGKEIKEPVDPFILSAGALLHDIGKTNNVFSHIHGLFGGALAEEFLDGLKIDPELRDAICRVVIRHTPTSMIPPETPEEKAVYDADTLDRLGLMGLLRGFIGKNGAMDKIMYTYMEKRKHDFKKLHYQVSKDLGLEGEQMMLAFIQIIEDRLKTRMDSIHDLFSKEGLLNSH
ncbi:MAG: HD domain-containing protein [Candidatus Lokiarchaeota archaeon]|nr:HD domain-containing protein [Candidatus Harpocratesius repetitus]